MMRPLLLLVLVACLVVVDEYSQESASRSDMKRSGLCTVDSSISAADSFKMVCAVAFFPVDQPTP